MKVIVVGGTHGNEKLGIDLVYSITKNPIVNVSSIIGNPLATARRTRYVDFDLNRAIKNKEANGHEKLRAQELAKEIDKNDFIIDLHTTTSNMGISIILSKTDTISRQIARLIKNRFKKITIIYSSKLDDKSNFINRLSEHGFVVEVGPCPHNKYRKAQYNAVLNIVNFVAKFEINSKNEDSLPREFLRVKDYVPYNSIDDGFFRRILNQDFMKFPDVDNFVKNTSGKLINLRNCYPIFIGEKSYIETGIAFSICVKEKWNKNENT
ncbi:succinylglutamate desuccinylase/aspartoacylase family protein [Bacteriovoracaceae bacterium]|nr:succinylglutamate desuccinylase/aspartoacylase family protein [Bacteriovoracaceae bacterium]